MTPVQDLCAAAARRWEELERARPDLAPAIALQQQLVRRQLAAAGELPGPLEALPPPAPARLEEKLARGIPAFRGEPIALPFSILVPLLGEMCTLLGGGPLGATPALRLREALDTRRLSAEALLAASFQRDARRIRTGAEQLGLAPDAVWLAAELALVPFAALLQAHWLGAPRTAGGAQPLRWDRGYCPACGSWPALVEVTAAGRTARCSFCGASWPLASEECPYCRERGTYAPLVLVFPDPACSERALELCHECAAYLKRLVVARPVPALLLAIEDLASADLDVAAAARGYGRPSLPHQNEAAGESPCP